MGETRYMSFLVGILALLSSIVGLNAESPYRYYEFEVKYGTISPLGVSQRAILINGQFPGPTIESDTNDNVIVNVINKLDEPFLMTWNGVWQRKMSWQDGVLGTNCPIPPNSNWTYKMQSKDQIGTYSYYPSTSLHRVGGGYGGFNIHRRSVIASPYPEPADQFTVTVGDWYTTDFKLLRKKLDLGDSMPAPDGILINGHPKDTVFTGEAGKTYLFRMANVGTMLSVNVRIQGHMLKLVEVEGSHVLQEMYESLDLHPGQSMSFLVTLHGSVKDYHIVASARFTKKNLLAQAVLHYVGSTTPPADPLPIGPTYQIHWSMKQARTFRWNLTANAARPNPQGSYHYGGIQITRTLVLANSAGKINGKKRYAINEVSYVNPDTPLKLADYFNIPGVFDLNSIKDTPTEGAPLHSGTSVVGLALHDFTEIIFQNNEKTLQSYHLDGHNFFVVAYGAKEWTPAVRRKYNMVDSVWRTTVQVYPNSWTVVLAALDNKGMWNLRSEIWHRRYLGQELYFRVWNDERSLLSENDIPPNALKCGKAVNY